MAKIAKELRIKVIRVHWRRTKNGYIFLSDNFLNVPGANPATSEFAYNHNASVVVPRQQRFFKVEENIFCFQNALGYPWRCKFLQRWR
jgi:hypothetical protein